MFGIGEDYRPDNDPSEVFWGWYLWRMSDKKEIPSRDDVRRLDHEWVSDIFLFENIATWVTNTSPMMKAFAARPEGGEVDVALMPNAKRTEDQPSGPSGMKRMF